MVVSIEPGWGRGELAGGCVGLQPPEPVPEGTRAGEWVFMGPGGMQELEVSAVSWALDFLLIGG